MKKFVCTVALLFCVVFMGVVSWWLVIKPAVEGTTEFERTDLAPVSVTIPLGGREFVDISIDGLNQTLEETNWLTMWQFNDTRIMRTSSPVEGTYYQNGVYYSSNKQVYKQFGSYYITVTSPNKLARVSIDSLAKAEPYTAYMPAMDETNEVFALPDVALPDVYVEENSWKLPVDVEGLVLGASGDDMSYYKDNWYFNYNFRYMKYLDAQRDAATRVTALSHKPLDWWYDDGDVFVVKAGDQYACVKKKDYTSCYYISSNDISYIMLNLE